VDKYIARVVKFNDRMRKILKAKNVVPNASIFDGMNVLIVKHYVMDFQK
jgi:hypothetical protein